MTCTGLQCTAWCTVPGIRSRNLPHLEMQNTPGAPEVPVHAHGWNSPPRHSSACPGVHVNGLIQRVTVCVWFLMRMYHEIVRVVARCRPIVGPRLSGHVACSQFPDYYESGCHEQCWMCLLVNLSAHLSWRNPWACSCWTAERVCV